MRPATATRWSVSVPGARSPCAVRSCSRVCERSNRYGYGLVPASRSACELVESLGLLGHQPAADGVWLDVGFLVTHRGKTVSPRRMPTASRFTLSGSLATAWREHDGHGPWRAAHRARRCGPPFPAKPRALEIVIERRCHRRRSRSTTSPRRAISCRSTTSARCRALSPTPPSALPSKRAAGECSDAGSASAWCK